MLKNTDRALLGTEKTGKLLFQYALPSIIAMTASTLYNIIDSIFIGHYVGSMALSALAIMMPLMNLAAAFGAMVGGGAAALMSIKLGQKDMETTRLILGNVLLLNITIGVAFGAIGLIFLDPILYAFGASEVTIVHARDFLRIILVGNVFTHIYLGLNNLLRASGFPRKSMMVMLIAVATNTVLAALFVVVFRWGMKGAAWATVIAQVTAMVIQLFHFLDKRNDIHLTRRLLRFKGAIVKGILSIGMAPFAMNVCSSIVVLFINYSLKKYGGDVAIGAYGIANRFIMIFAMTVMGLNQGMQPIVGYNYGAGRFDRVKRTYWQTVLAATCITVVGFVVGYFFPHTMASIFTDDTVMIDSATRALRIIVLTYPFIGFQMVSSMFFQAIGNAKVAMVLSMTRQLLFLLPLLALLPPYFGTDGVWTSMPIADTLATILAAWLIARQAKKFNRQGAELAGK